MRVAILAYLYEDTFAVGSRRSRALVKLLKKHDVGLKIYHRASFKQVYSQIIWALLTIKDLYINKADKIYISCGPYQILLFIPVLKLLSNQANIIIDFRDPFSINMKEKGYSGIPYVMLFLISRFMERVAYRLCQYFVVCTDGMYEEYEKIFSDKSKLRLILNGHDVTEEDMRNTINTRKPNDCSSELRMVCLGKFYDTAYNYRQSGVKFLKYMSKLKASENWSIVSLDIVGSDVDDTFFDLIRKLGIEDSVHIIKRMSYMDAVKYASKFDAGVAILPNQKTVYGTKLFDYIAAGIPVIDYYEKDAYIRKRFSKYLVEAGSIKKYVPLDIYERLKYSRENMMSGLVELVLG